MLARWHAALAAGLAVAGSASLTEVIGSRPAAILALTGAAIAAGLLAYATGRVM